MTININVLINQLESFNSKNDREIIKNGISKLFKELGYSAISEEIKNNRKAKSNALYGLSLYYKSAASDMYNTKGEVIYKHTQEYMTKLDEFKNAMTKLINTFLTDGTEKQQIYINLMNEYENEKYKLNEMLIKLDDDNLRVNKEEWKQLYNQYKLQDEEVKALKNQLDQFIMSNIA